MNTFIKTFLNDEDGAVTVDWVVLTAAIVGLGIAAITAVSNGVTGLGEAIASDLSTDGTTSTYIGAGIPAEDAPD